MDMTTRRPGLRVKTGSKIIHRAVLPSVRCPRSLRTVDTLLHRVASISEIKRSGSGGTGSVRCATLGSASVASNAWGRAMGGGASTRYSPRSPARGATSGGQSFMKTLVVETIRLAAGLGDTGWHSNRQVDAKGAPRRAPRPQLQQSPAHMRGQRRPGSRSRGSYEPGHGGRDARRCRSPSHAPRTGCRSRAGC